MTDFFDKGYAYVWLFDPQIALDAWDDIDQYELHTLVDEKGNDPWKVLSPPRTPKFIAFVKEIEKVSDGFVISRSCVFTMYGQNMPRCWERYGKKWYKPKRVEQHLDLFPFSEKEVNVKGYTAEHIWVWVPMIPVSRNQGLPTFMEGSHHYKEGKEYQSYNPVIMPGYALMFDARLKTILPKAGGGVVFVRAYDMAQSQSS